MIFIVEREKRREKGRRASTLSVQGMLILKVRDSRVGELREREKKKEKREGESERGELICILYVWI